VAVAGIIDEAWSLVGIDARASGIQFENRVPPDERVMGNPDRLAQVFVNLLRNAMIALESPSGRIQVRSRHVHRGTEAGIAIAVEDNGPGIPAEVLPDIFDAFVTTRLDANGTGLGLTVAQGIVTQHGGTITASNRKEGGASMEVWLPAAVGKV
jgi:signal transduction histidine kinase